MCAVELQSHAWSSTVVGVSGVRIIAIVRGEEASGIRTARRHSVVECRGFRLQVCANQHKLSLQSTQGKNGKTETNHQSRRSGRLAVRAPAPGASCPSRSARSPSSAPTCRWFVEEPFVRTNLTAEEESSPELCPRVFGECARGSASVRKHTGSGRGEKLKARGATERETRLLMSETEH